MNMNPVSSVKKWLMRSSDPSRLISSPWWLQKGRLSSSPVGSKVRESLLTICGAQKNSWWVSLRRPTSYSRHALKIQGTLRSLTFQNTKPVLRKEAKSSCPLALQWRGGRFCGSHNSPFSLHLNRLRIVYLNFEPVLKAHD